MVLSLRLQVNTAVAMSMQILTVFAAQASLLLQNAMLLSALRADKEKLSAELSALDASARRVLAALAVLGRTIHI